MMDVAASGGYYVALAADTIVAHPTTVTGSIGVIMLTVNADGLLQKIGVTTTAIKSGPLQGHGQPAAQPDTGGARHLPVGHRRSLWPVRGQGGRAARIPLETAKTLADGRIYTAQQALADKLVDRIGYIPDALALARQAAGVTRRGSSCTSVPASTAPRTMPARGAKATSMSRSPSVAKWSCRDPSFSTSGGPDAPPPRPTRSPSHCHTGSAGILGEARVRLALAGTAGRSNPGRRRRAGRRAQDAHRPASGRIRRALTN